MNILRWLFNGSPKKAEVESSRKALAEAIKESRKAHGERSIVQDQEHLTAERALTVARAALNILTKNGRADK